MFFKLVHAGMFFRACALLWTSGFPNKTHSSSASLVPFLMKCSSDLVRADTALATRGDPWPNWIFPTPYIVYFFFR